MKVTSEIIDVFWEENVPVAFMYQNGSTVFYRPKKMTKEDVRHLLGADKADEK